MRNFTPTHALLCFVALPIDVVGTIGNLALLAVLAQRRSDKPMYSILKWMSATNAVLLVLNMLFQSLPAIWHITNVMAPWYRFAVVNAQYITPIATIAHFVKVWLTVLLSVERWTAVCCPLKFRSSFSISRVRMLIALIFFAAVLYNLPRYFETECVPVRALRSNSGTGSGNNSNNNNWNWNNNWNSTIAPHWTNESRVIRSSTCAPSDSFFHSSFYRFGYGVVSYSLLVFLLPVGTALVLNCHMIYEIHKGNSTLAVLSIVQKFERRISKVPLAMAIVFCVLQSPAMCVNILHFAGWAESSGLQHTNLWKSMLGMAVVLVLADSLADFILYFYNMNYSCSCLLHLCSKREHRKRNQRSRATHIKASTVNETRYCPVARTAIATSTSNTTTTSGNRARGLHETWPKVASTRTTTTTTTTTQGAFTLP